MMDSINTYSPAKTGSAAVFKATSTAERVSDAPESQSVPSAQARSTQTISTLARQLADSASRADARDSTLSRSELGDKAKTILNQIVGDAYFANKAKHDSEVPKTSDPELLARAKQATAYVNSAATGSKSEKNPFAGLSREQLANIVYDDSGTYTVNERHAAWRESYDQEEAWRVKVCAQAMDEYNSTGKMTNFFSSVLDYYNKLPAIEQAQYPDNYASDLKYKINLDFNYRTHQAEGKTKSDEEPMDLMKMLFDQGPKQPNEVSPLKNSTDSPTIRSNP